MKRKQRSRVEQLIRDHRLAEWRSSADERAARAARLLAFWRRPAALVFDDLSPAELAFRRLLADRAGYARWAELVRQRWRIARSLG